jgi:hypothetical protein
MRGIIIEPSLKDEELENKDFLIYMSSYINQHYDTLKNVFSDVLNKNNSEETIKMDIFKLLYTLLIVTNKA